MSRRRADPAMARNRQPNGGNDLSFSGVEKKGDYNKKVKLFRFRNRWAKKNS